MMKRAVVSREEGKKIPHGAKPMSGERGALSGAAQDAVKCAAGAGQCALLPLIIPPNPTVAPLIPAEATQSL